MDPASSAAVGSPEWKPAISSARWSSLVRAAVAAECLPIDETTLGEGARVREQQ